MKGRMAARPTDCLRPSPLRSGLGRAELLPQKGLRVPRPESHSQRDTSQVRRFSPNRLRAAARTSSSIRKFVRSLSKATASSKSARPLNETSVTMPIVPVTASPSRPATVRPSRPLMSTRSARNSFAKRKAASPSATRPLSVRKAHVLILSPASSSYAPNSRPQRREWQQPRRARSCSRLATFRSVRMRFTGTGED